MMDNNSSIREILMACTTQQLDDMLQKELSNDPLDETAVRVIMGVLAEREANHPVNVDSSVAEAWERYQAGQQAAQTSTAPRRIIKWGWAIKAASVFLAVGIAVSCLSQEVNAESLFDKIARWSESIFELFSPGEQNDNKVEYVFKTDHPGLQQVYDLVSELGATVPVVPMYLPDDYTLMELKQDVTSKGAGVVALFSGKEGHIVLRFDIYSNNISAEYHKDQTDVTIFEISGITHYVMQNIDTYTATWSNQNIECVISIDCQESILQNILESIYIMEGE